ncbi:gamma-glutamylcyclotransferase [Robbsia andropogonis]|uniref:gamma-glutamylcyclotransferase n=1 Tax=Robbsia andropogonis TaxID=28092 RepID=UPI000467C154|nr:gamma-glutamylcyclotransferase [Robbsia andropogonis]
MSNLDERDSLAGIYPPPNGAVVHLSEADLAASRRQAFASHAEADDIWIFGYGSLIWNPGLPVLEAVRARVHGYHRGLFMWSRLNRGTAEQPGLVLAIDRGGSCSGMAFRLAFAGSTPHLETLWQREMSLGAYRPAWLSCRLTDGRQVRALSFVIRRDSAAYAGLLPDAVLRHVMRQASGIYGTTREYVEKTVAALRAAGIPDPHLERLLARCVDST